MYLSVCFSDVQMAPNSLDAQHCNSSNSSDRLELK